MQDQFELGQKPKSINSSETLAAGTRQSQRQQILSLLIAARGSEVPALALAECSLQYSSRVFELRRAGYVIENRVEVSDGRKFGFFRLVGGPQ